jgi:hypothetical protein
VLHTIRRHGGKVVIIEVRVPLRRSCKRLWYCPRGRFRRLIAFTELAGASVD